MITGWQATSNFLRPDIQNFSTITIDGSSNTAIYQNCLSWKPDKRRGRGYSWMNPGVRYCIWLQCLRSSFCSPRESITPLHKGQLRGQEGKSAKKAQGRRRIKNNNKKKPAGSPASCVKSWLFPNETRAPIVKPKSSLVATISSKKKKESITANGERRLMTA